MRHLLTGLVIAVITSVVPTLALAGNQDVADEIANNLRDSGQLSGYQIGVKYRDGTAWIRGRVRNQQQMDSVLQIAFQTPGVSRVVNGLTTDSSALDQPTQASLVAEATQPAGWATATRRKVNIAERLETVITGGVPVPGRQIAAKVATGRSSNRAQRVPSSFRQQSARPAMALEAPVASGIATVGASERPIPIAYTSPTGGMPGEPIPAYVGAAGAGVAPACYDQPCMPNYAWPSYAAYPNYAALTYPRQYSPTAWPFIGPFYPYPQVPLGWRKVTLEWDDGWWMLDFKD